MDASAFFEKLDALTKGERTALKRSCGVMLPKADGSAIAAFYKCLPYEVPEYEESRWFAAASFYCLWENEPKRPLESILGEMKKDSDTVANRVIALADMRWDEDGFFLSKLTRLVKMVKQKGYAVDAVALLEDMLRWDSDSRYIQRRWLKELVK